MTAEKGEHERAPPVWVSCPTPLRATLRAPPSKWAIGAFFPAGERSEPRSRTARRAPADRSPRRIATWAASGVAVPLAFFCTLFFRHRKKSVSVPWDGKSQSAPESARQSPPGELLTAELFLIDASRVAFRSPPCTPFGSPTEAIERPVGLQALSSRRSRRVRPHQREISYGKIVV